MADETYYFLRDEHIDPQRLRRERARARELRKTPWWHALISRGLCHYCGEKFATGELTMDHVVPLARGGRSTRGNLVPCCRRCNENKKLATPAETLLRNA